MIYKKVLILGDGPEAKALQKIIALFSQHPPDIFCLTDLSASNFTKKTLSDVKVKIFRQILGKKNIVIGIDGDTMQPSQFIHLIHLLRSDFTWEGGFIAIVKNRHYKTQLDSMPLSGAPEKSSLFLHCPGHLSLRRPIQIQRLFEALFLIKEMYWEQWQAFLDRSKLFQIKNDLTTAEELLKNGDFVRCKENVLQIIDNIPPIDWLPLMIDPHRDISLVNSLIDEFKSPVTIEEKALPEIIERIKIIFTKTCIR